MPELPDLQVFSRNLDKALKKKKVAKVIVPVTKKLNVSVATLKKSIEGQSITKVVRKGKELHFVFDNGSVLGLHLMLHGNIILFEAKNTDKHTIIELLFQDKTGMALSDWQGIAVPTLNPEEQKVPDALSKEINFKYLKGVLQSKSNIKNVLMDQKIIGGIGNAYADEILWDARIYPFSASNKIPDMAIKALTKSIKKVLTKAEKQIRKKRPDIIAGEERDFLLIHNAKKKNSPLGAAIEIKTAGARKTYYTKEQKVY